ncbi:MAG: DoxX family protein [Chlamydiales bacterium]|nr:DoxX family protein [Chlamydiales bacterium]
MKRGFFTQTYFGLSKVGIFLGHILLLIVRLYWGGSLVLTGIGKFMALQKVAGYFGSLGLPFPEFTAGFVALVELVGGAALFLGLFSRVMSFLLVILFCVAYATAHTESVHMLFANPQLFLKQDPFLYLYASLLVFCFGAGFASFDYWWERSRFSNKLS